jgi:hypothetical protein
VNLRNRNARRRFIFTSEGSPNDRKIDVAVPHQIMLSPQPEF